MGLIFLGIFIWILLVLILPIVLTSYVTGKREIIASKLREAKQIYWADKIEDCFENVPTGPKRWTPYEYKKMWKECWSFLKGYQTSDTELNKIKRVKLLSDILTVVLVGLPLAAMAVLYIIASA